MADAFYSKDNGLPDYIEFGNMSKPVKRTVINFIINECLVIAGKHNGKVYGGFVRDVLVPLTGNNGDYGKTSEWKDVDLWFSNDTDAKAFIKDMGRKLKPVKYDHSLNEKQKNALYSFPRLQYHLYIWNILVAWIDVCISPTLPVNDFNINHLAFQYRPGSISSYIWGVSNDIKGDYTMTVEGVCKYTAEELKSNIAGKVAIMDREHIDMLSDEEYGPDRLTRIQNRYMNRGWTIQVGEKTFVCARKNISMLDWIKFIGEMKELLYQKFLDGY